MRKCLAFITIQSIIFLSVCPTMAADWGYDESARPASEEQVVPLRAVAQPLSSTLKSGKKTDALPVGTVKPAAASPVKSASKPLQAVPSLKPALSKAGAKTVKSSAPRGTLLQECWAQVYQIGSGSQLTAEQRIQLNKIIDRKVSAGDSSAAEAMAVLKFWPRLADYLVAHPEQKENYGLLLHALLRWRARNQNAYLGQGNEDALVADESAFVAQVLGPIRLSVGGVVPFSEDALNAYTDMACFVYEQQHPGKSVDAADNRDLFGMIIAKKFKDAPTKKDQEAMSGFDLEWAKFKIAWSGADTAHRSVLLEKLVSSGAGVAWAQGHDAVLEVVLSNWPGSKAAVVSTATASQRK